MEWLLWETEATSSVEGKGHPPLSSCPSHSWKGKFTFYQNVAASRCLCALGAGQRAKGALSGQASWECSTLLTGKPCLSASPRPRMGNRRSTLQTAKGPSGSVTLARSHPDVVGGEQDGAESPGRSGTPTGWTTFAGIPQTAQKRGASNGSRLGFLFFEGKQKASISGQGPSEGNEDYKGCPTRNLSALISSTNAFPPLLHSFRG